MKKIGKKIKEQKGKISIVLIIVISIFIGTFTCFLGNKAGNRCNDTPKIDTVFVEKTDNQLIEKLKKENKKLRKEISEDNIYQKALEENLHKAIDKIN